MSGNVFGTLLRVTTFGESHGPALGAVVDGVPAGLGLTEEWVQADLDRRRPGRSELHSARSEADRVRILSGTFEGLTTGAPVALLIENQDARPGDYEALRDLYRPGHADWTMEHKFGVRDWRGGGRSSGRETVARVAAGAVARRILAEVGVEVIGVVESIGEVTADLAGADWQASRDLPLRCPDPDAAARMEAAVRAVRQDQDSLGGVVVVRASGVPAGLGEPVFDKLEARLGAALLSIGAVKAVEIGDGFGLVRRRGSEVNDAPTPSGGFASNHGGGVLGGISNGEEIRVRVAVKPTPSIGRAQQTVDRPGRPQTIEIEGRHDPCLAPRIVAVAEAMTLLVLADALLIHRARHDFPDTRSTR